MDLLGGLAVAKEDRLRGFGEARQSDSAVSRRRGRNACVVLRRRKRSDSAVSRRRDRNGSARF